MSVRAEYADVINIIATSPGPTSPILTSICLIHIGSFEVWKAAPGSDNIRETYEEWGQSLCAFARETRAKKGSYMQMLKGST